MSEPSITLSERATRRIAEILKAEAAPALFRVSVEGGGCSGFQYRFDLVTETTQDDLLVELDFVDDLIGAQFKLNNPNVTAACGCGTSFSV